MNSTSLHSRAQALRDVLVYCLLAAFIVGLGWFAGTALPFAAKYPSAWVIPLADWISAFFEWLVYGLKFFEGTDFAFSPRDLTRGFVSVMAQPLAFTEALFFKGFESGMPPLPWFTVVGVAFILGHWLGGWRIALVGGLSFLYLFAFGVWDSAMETFALVVITVPLVFLIGLAVGIPMARFPRFEAVMEPLFGILQSMPPFAYLVPIVVLYGVGDVPAMVATLVFAVPPVARCVALGLKSVRHDLIEAGLMMGCNRFQMLWRVQLPAARSILLVGLNQGIMQTLAMIVLASLIGASGLGSELLTSLQSLRMGQALEQGLAIVIIAVALDRLSKAYALKPPVYADRSLAWWKRHPHAALAIALVLASVALVWSAPDAATILKEHAVTTAPFWDAGIDWINVHLYDAVQAFRNFALVKVLIPIRNFFQGIPWVTFVGLVMLIGYRAGGWRVAVPAGLLILFPVVMGLWKETMTTVYMIGTAAVVCVLGGFVVGLVASRSRRLSKTVLGVCDFLQTFPSFIYLIPVVMLFKVSDLSAIIAVLLFAVVPMIRYTILGLENVPAQTLEAAAQQGTTPLQRLAKVELPIALPEIMLGVSQVIFMALFMVAITSLIGTQDLGAQINAARSGNDTGKALVAGLCIAFLGIAADRIIGAWARKKRAA